MTVSYADFNSDKRHQTYLTVMNPSILIQEQKDDTGKRTRITQATTATSVHSSFPLDHQVRGGHYNNTPSHHAFKCIPTSDIMKFMKEI